MNVADLIRNMAVGESLWLPGAHMTFYGASSAKQYVQRLTGHRFTVRTIVHRDGGSDPCEWNWFILRTK